MLPHSKDAVTLPRVATLPPLARSDEFVPVMRTRRYNLLKIKDLCQLRERDIRLGRVRTESSNLQKLLMAEKTQRQSQEAYQALRVQRYRQVRNQSYLGLMERRREEVRVWSVER